MGGQKKIWGGGHLPPFAPPPPGAATALRRKTSTLRQQLQCATELQRVVRFMGSNVQSVVNAIPKKSVSRSTVVQ